MSKMMQSEQVASFSSLIASIQRHYGLWRLQDVLNQYRWPESLEFEIVYGASSIGSVSLKFLSAFSATAGKKSHQHFDSEVARGDRSAEDGIPMLLKIPRLFDPWGGYSVIGFRDIINLRRLIYSKS